MNQLLVNRNAYRNVIERLMIGPSYKENGRSVSAKGLRGEKIISRKADRESIELLADL